MASLSAAMMAVPALNVFADTGDVIDTSLKCSVTLHKYDMTAAQNDGIDLSQFTANGKQDTNAESTLKDYIIEGVVFSYCKVGDVTTVSNGGSIIVKYQMDNELAKTLGLEVAADQLYTSDQINEGLANILTSNTAAKNALEKYLGYPYTKVDMAETDDKGETKATNLEQGLYLFVETKVPANVHTTVDPFFVSLPMTDAEGSAWFYDVDVYPKNQTDIPDINKLVRQHDDAELYSEPEYADIATASEGDRVDYLIVSRLPSITSKATYLSKYTFTDEAAEGMTYNNDAAIYFYDNKEDAEANNTANAVKSWPYGSTKFTAGFNQTHGTFAVSSSGLEEINTTAGTGEQSYYSKLWMVVSYSMTVDSTPHTALGDTGNPNTVNLTWCRSNDAHDDSLEDEANVFSYGLNLSKEFSGEDASKADATAVTFSLRNVTDGHYVTARQTDTSSGVYYVTDATKGDKESDGTVFKPNADGKLIINGLEADEYELVELTTDDGYVLLKSPIRFVITATDATITPSVTTLYDSKDIAANKEAGTNKLIYTHVTDASTTVDGSLAAMSADDTSENAYADMTVTNAPGFTLPATGGLGTIIFTVVGCTVAFAGVAVATKKSKKKGQEA